MITQRNAAVAERIRELNPHMLPVGSQHDRGLLYTEQEETLLEVLRRHTLVDPIFREKWTTGRCSPVDIVAVLAGYGVTA